MYYLTSTLGKHLRSGHIGTEIPVNCIKFAEYFQADGDELDRALNILGRSSSPKRVHIFCGNDVKELILNWY